MLILQIGVFSTYDGVTGAKRVVHGYSYNVISSHLNKQDSYQILASVYDGLDCLRKARLFWSMRPLGLTNLDIHLPPPLLNHPVHSNNIHCKTGYTFTDPDPEINAVRTKITPDHRYYGLTSLQACHLINEGSVPPPGYYQPL